MEVDAADGRIYLSTQLREKFGERFELVDRGDRLVLIPVDEDPLAALREEFAEIDASVADLRSGARQDAMDDAGR